MPTPEQLLETIQADLEDAPDTLKPDQVPLPPDEGSTDRYNYSSSSSSESEEEEVTPPVPKSKKAAKLNLSFSDRYQTSVQWVTIQKTNDWLDVLQEIHSNIGCAQFSLKPSLQWKISEKQKSRVMGLEDVTHWEDLKAEVESEELKKKNGNVTVDLLIAEDYIDGKKGTKGVKGFTPINLDANPNVDTPASHPPPSQHTSGSHKQQLRAYLTSCKDCPHTGSYCARKENGTHVRIPNPMVKEWAKFLASGVIGITCEVLPKVAKWDIYYKVTACASNPWNEAKVPASVETLPAVTVAPPGDDTNMMLLSLTQMQMQMQFMQSMHAISQNYPPTVPGPATLVSAPHDLTDVCIVPNYKYTQLDIFFEDLESKHPQRNLNGMMRKLIDGRILTTDEFTLWSEEELVGTFGLLVGEARWILREVKMALKAAA
ncbi:hypothetical protein K439DRAFT_1618927 [Ramaria rubella]|nr:hypothetical protein K439DRAFT_1618927 [Ramaria rubella]